jgi:RNA polymerase sigma-70 factor (ECF subfamily)
VAARHDDDLELARRCAEGDEAAWERFVRDYRSALYRAADALDPSGGARELADSLYADLYGLETRDGERRSLFRYFQGRSSLATWLRAVLAQRYVDRLRVTRRLAPLPDEDQWPSEGLAAPAAGATLDPDGLHLAGLVQKALSHAIAKLSDRDRLRLGCYYVQQLTLADTGRLLGEHEATASRHLARTRRAIREDVERHLRVECGLSAEQIAQSLDSMAEDPGTLDLEEMLTPRKESASGRSIR